MLRENRKQKLHETKTKIQVMARQTVENGEFSTSWQEALGGGALFHIRIMKTVNSQDKEGVGSFPSNCFEYWLTSLHQRWKWKPVRTARIPRSPEGIVLLFPPRVFHPCIHLPGSPFLSPSEWSLVWPAGPCLFLNVLWTHKIAGDIGGFSLRSNVCHCWF